MRGENVVLGMTTLSCSSVSVLEDGEETRAESEQGNDITGTAILGLDLIDMA